LTYSQNEAPETTPFIDSVIEAKNVFMTLEQTIAINQTQLHTQKQILETLAKFMEQYTKAAAASSTTIATSFSLPTVINENTVLKQWSEQAVYRIHHHQTIPSYGVYLITDHVICIDALPEQQDAATTAAVAVESSPSIASSSSSSLSSSSSSILNSTTVAPAVAVDSTNITSRLHILNTANAHFKVAKFSDHGKYGINMTEGNTHFRVAWDDAKTADAWYELVSQQKH